MLVDKIVEVGRGSFELMRTSICVLSRFAELGHGWIGRRLGVIWECSPQREEKELNGRFSYTERYAGLDGWISGRLEFGKIGILLFENGREII